MKQAKLVIWDFDGAICDSLIECITVTRIAGIRIAQPKMAITEKNLHEICPPDEITELYYRMRHLRPFVVKGQDYLWQYFNLNLFSRSLRSFPDYKAIFDTVFDATKDKVYEEVFYESRRLVQELMGRQYFTLFQPYPGVLYAFRASQRWHRNYVCTARDQQSVNLLFGDNAIKFPRERIFSKDYNGLIENDGRGKAEQILEILHKEGGKDQNFLIIEDQVNVPAELKNLCPNMEVIFTEYGYGLEHDWSAAGITGIRKISDPGDLVYNLY